MQLLRNTNIDFVGRRKIGYFVSGILLLAGIASLIAHGGPRLSIDFTGGTMVEVNIQPAPPVEEVRAALQGAGIATNQVQTFGSPDEILMYLPPGWDEGLENASVPEILKTNLSSVDSVELRRSESVGPKIGNELRAGALNSIGMALVLIVVYITLRFEFRYGIAAVMALTHDVLVTLGLFSLLNKEIGLAIIAAFLTIIGYSLNDTIVVFDRIRENMRTRRKETYDEVINRSINETLSRTVITSITTLIVALTLFLAGGAVIHDFSFALVVGVLVGTYSSIFVAGSLLIAWYHWRSTDKKRLAKRPAGAAAVRS